MFKSKIVRGLVALNLLAAAVLVYNIATFESNLVKVVERIDIQEQMTAELETVATNFKQRVAKKPKPTKRNYVSYNHVDYDRAFEINFRCTTVQVGELASFEDDLLISCDYNGRILGDNPRRFSGSLYDNAMIDSVISTIEQTLDKEEAGE